MGVEEICSSGLGQAAGLLAADDALTITGLSKRFATTVAVDALSLAVPRGSFFGLVGPNGAGKTTALSMAVGLLRPDAGTARIFGHDVWEDPDRAKELVGVLPDGLSLPERLTGRELLTYRRSCADWTGSRWPSAPTSCCGCSNWPRPSARW